MTPPLLSRRASPKVPSEPGGGLLSGPQASEPYRVPAGKWSWPLSPIVEPRCAYTLEAVLANGQGRHGDAVVAMRPVLGTMSRLGGSHAQQDVLEQLFLDSALKAGLEADARMLLERVA